MKLVFLFFIFVCSSFRFSEIEKLEKTSTPTYENVKYGPEDRDVLDVYQASSSHQSPLVIFIHGGGFISGDKEMKGNLARFVEEFNKRGVTLVSINYPFISSHSLDVIFRHIARSVQFMRYHAKDYNIDKNKVAVFGNSAGAGSALWLDFHDDLQDLKSSDPVLHESSKPICAAAISTQATYDLAQWGHVLGIDQQMIVQALSKKDMFPYFESHMSKLSQEQKVAYNHDVDLLGLIDAKDAPVFLFNHQKEGKEPNLLHHPKHSEAIQSRCQQKGVQVSYFSPQDGKAIEGQKALFAFIMKYLKP